MYYLNLHIQPSSTFTVLHTWLHTFSTRGPPRPVQNTTHHQCHFCAIQTTAITLNRCRLDQLAKPLHDQLVTVPTPSLPSFRPGNYRRKGAHDGTLDKHSSGSVRSRMTRRHTSHRNISNERNNKIRHQWVRWFGQDCATRLLQMMGSPIPRKPFRLQEWDQTTFRAQNIARTQSCKTTSCLTTQGAHGRVA